MLQTRLFYKLGHRSRSHWPKMVRDISPSKDTSIHQIWLEVVCITPPSKEESPYMYQIWDSQDACTHLFGIPISNMRYMPQTGIF